VRDPKTVVAVLAADHVFEDGKQFAKLCAQACAVADTGEIVTFGVTPGPSRHRLQLHPSGRAAGA
jgi:mannose-1-phosphate guanylyltransferase